LTQRGFGSFAAKRVWFLEIGSSRLSDFQSGSIIDVDDNQPSMALSKSASGDVAGLLSVCLICNRSTDH